METPRVLIAADFADEGIQLLKTEGFETVVFPELAKPENQELFRKMLAKFSPHAVSIRSSPFFGKEEFSLAKDLKVLFRGGVGLDNVDRQEARKRGIQISNAASGNENAVAEFVLGTTLSVLRDIPRSSTALKNGQWIKEEVAGEEICGKTVGIIGCGRIGSRVAHLFKAFGVKVLAYDPKLKTRPQEIDFVEDLDQLFRQSDIVTLHVDLNPDTLFLMNEARLAKMKKGSYLINTSRGKVVDFDALVSSLRKGHLSGAALDVYAVEPPPPEEREKIQNLRVVATPHSASETKEAKRAISLEMARVIIAKLKEDTIKGAVGIPHLSAEERKDLEPERRLRHCLAVFLKTCTLIPEKNFGVKLYLEGDFTELQQKVFMQSVLHDLLEVKYEHADFVAEEKGIEWGVVHKPASHKKISIELLCGEKTTLVSGRVDEIEELGVKVRYPVLTRFGGYVLSGMRLKGKMLVVENYNVVGAWDGVLAALTRHRINREAMVSNENSKEDDELALLVVRINRGELTEEVLQGVRQLKDVKSAHILSF